MEEQGGGVFKRCSCFESPKSAVKARHNQEKQSHLQMSVHLFQAFIQTRIFIRLTHCQVVKDLSFLSLAFIFR